MRPALLGRLLLVVSLAWLGLVVLPGHLRAGAVRSEAAFARAEARRAAVRERAHAARGTAPELSPSEKVREVRRSLLEALGGLVLEDVRLEVRQAPLPEGSVVVKLSAQGRFVTLIEATSRLVEPDRGLALTAVRLTPRGEHAQMELEAQCP